MLRYVFRTNQIVVFWQLALISLQISTNQRAIRRERSPFRLVNAGFSVFLTCILPRFLGIMRYCWTDKRHQITKSKRITHAVKMEDSSRENGVLFIAVRSRWFFPLDESEWNEQFFNGKLCCKIHDLLSVPIIFFWIGLLDECLTKINFGRFCVCFR